MLGLARRTANRAIGTQLKNFFCARHVPKFTLPSEDNSQKPLTKSTREIQKDQELLTAVINSTTLAADRQKLMSSSDNINNPVVEKCLYDALPAISQAVNTVAEIMDTPDAGRPLLTLFENNPLFGFPLFANLLRGELKQIKQRKHPALAISEELNTKLIQFMTEPKWKVSEYLYFAFLFNIHTMNSSPELKEQFLQMFSAESQKANSTQGSPKQKSSKNQILPISQIALAYTCLSPANSSDPNLVRGSLSSLFSMLHQNYQLREGKEIATKIFGNSQKSAAGKDASNLNVSAAAQCIFLFGQYVSGTQSSNDKKLKFIPSVEKALDYEKQAAAELTKEDPLLFELMQKEFIGKVLLSDYLLEKVVVNEQTPLREVFLLLSALRSPGVGTGPKKMSVIKEIVSIIKNRWENVLIEDLTEFLTETTQAKNQLLIPASTIQQIIEFRTVASIMKPQVEGTKSHYRSLPATVQNLARGLPSGSTLQTMLIDSARIRNTLNGLIGGNRQVINGRIIAQLCRALLEDYSPMYSTTVVKLFESLRNSIAAEGAKTFPHHTLSYLQALSLYLARGFPKEKWIEKDRKSVV